MHPPLGGSRISRAVREPNNDLYWTVLIPSVLRRAFAEMAGYRKRAIWCEEIGVEVRGNAVTTDLVTESRGRRPVW
jgi:hypothetical protein